MKKKILLTIGILLIGSVVFAQRSPRAIVEEERQKYIVLHEPGDIVTFLRAVAAELNKERVPGGPFGILVKESGHNCNGFSCDIICSGQGAQQRQWDVLSDAGGVSAPGWDEVSGPTVRTCEIVTTQPIPKPEPCPKCPPDQQTEVLALRGEKQQLEQKVTEALAAASEQRARAEDFERQLNECKAKRPRCTASLFGIKIPCKIIE